MPNMRGKWSLDVTKQKPVYVTVYGTRTRGLHESELQRCHEKIEHIRAGRIVAAALRRHSRKAT